VIVDSLTFVGESLFGVNATAADLLRAMEKTGVDRALVCPLRPRGYHLVGANDVVAAAVAAHPDRFIGFARVDPWQPDAPTELERAAALGLRGLYLHPWEETFRISDRLLDAVLDTAERLDLPVIVAAGYPWLSEALQIGELAGRFPDLRFVATNGGQLNVSGLGQTDAELALEACPNLALQTAGVYREDFLEGVVARFGSDRLLYASGFPYLDPRLEILRVRWAPNLDARARGAVLGGNAERLLRLTA
jgi:predicted TIM-barrel fold metal-dependent hydrolase